MHSSLLKAKLARLPARLPPGAIGQDGDLVHDEGADTFQEDVNGSGPSRLRTTVKHNQQDFSPRTAEGYFDRALQVDVPLDTGSAAFRVYYTPPRPGKQAATRKPSAGAAAQLDVSIPSLPRLQRGGSSIAHTEEDDEECTDTANSGTVFVLHHGAGFSALSYALTSAEITRKTDGEVGVLAYDCRGHGRTELTDVREDPLDMSLETLASDLVRLLAAMYPVREHMPSLVLVGHSMGGSVVVAASQSLIASGFTRVTGVAVLDVVEGTAMDALGVMRGIVQSQPTGFSSVEDAVRWHIDSNTIANLESARISVPPLVHRNPDFSSSAEARAQDQEQAEILSVSDTSTATKQAYIWRADLLATEPHWKGWFQGLSSRFLAARTARLLLLAGTDRLDKELMIGQMQGKYQLEVISDVGHSLQQDAPERTAHILVDFWKRNERARLPFVNLRKVGER